MWSPELPSLWPVHGERAVILFLRAETVRKIFTPSHTGQGVPSSAVANRGGSEAVFVVEDGKAVRIAVEAGLETDGWREIVRPVLGPEKKIILEGMLLVNEGDEVRTQDVSL